MNPSYIKFSLIKTINAMQRDPEAYVASNTTGVGYHQMHLNAVYDLMEERYLDVVLQKRAEINERTAFMRERDYEVKGETLADGSDKKTAKYIRFRASGYDQFVRGCFRSLGKGFTKEEIAQAIELQGKIRQATTVIKVKTVEEVVKRSSPNDRLIDTSAAKFRGAPYLTRWADTHNLKAAAHAFALGGSVPELQAKMDEINEKILAGDRRIRNNKTLAVYVRNYEENERYGKGYRRTKNQDQYYRINESRIMLFEAAEDSTRCYSSG